MFYYTIRNERFISGDTTPGSASREHLLYALHGAPDQVVTDLERNYFTPHIDEPGAIIIKSIIKNGVESLSDSQRHLWTRYVMALHTRHPGAVEQLREAGQNLTIESLSNDEEYAALRTEGMPESLLGFVNPWLVNNFGMLTMPAIIDHEPTHNAIMAMDWWLMKFQYTTNDFITGDRPLIWMEGADKPNFHFVLPLTPRLCFFAAKNARKKALILATNKSLLLRQINVAIIGQSEYVYASHPGHERFVKSHLGRPTELREERHKGVARPTKTRLWRLT